MDSRVKELLHYLYLSNSLNECWNVLLGFSHQLEFAQIIYSAMYAERASEAHAQLVNVDANWLPNYRKKEFYNHDIIFDYPFRSLKPFEYYAKELKKSSYLTSQQRHVGSEAANSGIKNIIAFLTHQGRNHSHGCFSIIFEDTANQRQATFLKC